MAGAEDRRDRKEARQLMLAVGVAVILLALLLGGALHFLADWFTGPVMSMVTPGRRPPVWSASVTSIRPV